jgi:hypothetical protein
MNDNDVLERVRESLAGVSMRTPVEMVIARARARRRRRLSALAAGAAATVVAATLGLAAVIGSGTRAPVSPGGAQLTAFSVGGGPDGATLILRKGAQYRLDPDALRQALAQRGIPALVNVGSMCDTAPEPQGLDRVISSRRLADGSVFTTFDASALPAGSMISIGYFPTRTEFALIEDGAPLHCSNSPAPGTSSGSGDGAHAQQVHPG